MSKKKNIKYVYEFTNKRKLTKSEFLKWFQKKFLYTVRKFSMIKKGDVIGYRDKKDFRSVVLKDLLKMFVKKAPVEIVNISRSKKDITKRAVTSTSDTETRKIIRELINGSAKIKKAGPVIDNKIKPLYLFLDKEVKLYARLKRLKCGKQNLKKDKLYGFIEDLEKKHPELKHSVVQSYLKLFRN